MMKQKLLLTLALLLTAATGAWADSSCGDGLTWTLSSGTLTISKTGEGTGAMPDYTLQNVPWYNEMNNITSVVIGDGVTEIGQYAFFNCSNLASLTIGSSLQSIGVQAFSRCSKLASVNLPASVTKIEDNAFYDCSNLSSVVIHATSVPTCGNDAFGLYKSGRKIFVPAASVDTYKAGWTTYANDIIGYNGTCGATGHESDVLYAMDGESPNKTLYIVGTGAMTGYDWNGQPWYSNKDNITSVVIGNGVTSIGKYAFHECSNLASVTIGNSLQTIGEWAFKNCSMASITLPATMTSIGPDAFYGCSNLSTVIIKATSLTGYGGDAFSGNKSGRKIYVPANSANTYKAEWPAYASDIIGFNGTCGATGHEWDVLWALTGESPNYTLNIMKVGETGAMADYDNGNAKPWNGNRENIKTIIVGDGVTHIGDHAFDYCAQTSLTIGSDVTTIGDYAFHHCGNITSIVIPNSVETIGASAFEFLSSLTNVTIGSGLKSIGAQGFHYNSQLSSVVIRAASLTIYGEVFNLGKSGRKIYVPANSANTYKAGWPAYASDIIGYNGTCGATGNESNVVYALTGTSPNCTLYIIGTGAMMDCGDGSSAPWYSNRGDITSVVIGDGVTTIGAHAFGQNNNTLYTHLTSLTIGNDVTTIGDYAFYHCTGLTSIVIPNSVQTIKSYAFERCSGVTSLTIGSGVTTLEDHAFYGLGITSLIIPANVTTFGNSVFNSCSNLKSVLIRRSSLTSYGHKVFDNNASGRKILVPSGSESNYTSVWKDTDWGNYVNDIYGYQNCGETGHESDVVWAVTGESTNKTLFVCGTGAMAGYDWNTMPWYSNKDNITSVVIGDGVTDIGQYAFYEHFNLASVTIGNSLETIGVWAFENCTGLTSVILPASMTSVGDMSFANCSNLSTVIVRATSVPTCQNNAFLGNKSGRKIYVPAASAETYKATSHWSDYQNDIIGYYGTGGPTGHTLILHAAVPVTCTTAGNNEYWECVECHKYFSDENGTTEIAANSWVINALGHTLSAHPAVAATCTEAGNSAYWECTVCYKYFSNSAGTSEIAENSWVILATGHTLTAHAAVEATCTTAGNSAYWECTVCYKYFSNSAGTSEIAENSWVIAAHHKVVNNICTGCGKYGYCGTSGHASDVTWELTGTSPNYTLNISGTGAMTEYDCEARPWYSQRTEITSVIIGNGVTGISQYAFDGCSNLASLTIGNNLETIGVWAFRYCNSLTSIEIPASVKSIGNSSFLECNSLTSVTLNSNPQIQSNAFPGKATVTMNLTANPVGGDKWMTFFNNRYNFLADENTTVYKGILSGSSIVLKPVEDKIVTAGTAVILKSTGNPVMTLNSADSSDTNSNSLQGVSDLAGKTAANPSTTYVLNYKEGTGVGFYKLKSGKTLGYGKAYLDTSTTGAPSYLNFEENETTEVREVKEVNVVIEVNDNSWYTLDGRKMDSKPTAKGLYIVNGKKVVIK